MYYSKCACEHSEDWCVHYVNVKDCRCICRVDYTNMIPHWILSTLCSMVELLWGHNQSCRQLHILFVWKSSALIFFLPLLQQLIPYVEDDSSKLDERVASQMRSASEERREVLEVNKVRTVPVLYIYPVSVLYSLMYCCCLGWYVHPNPNKLFFFSLIYTRTVILCRTTWSISMTCWARQVILCGTVFCPDMFLIWNELNL